MILPVILCGGSGTRLWPLSRKNYPKQLISFSNGDSLLQETAQRVTALPDTFSPMIICNEAYRFVIAEQLRAIGIDNPHIILEPCAKNTAPATALAALSADKDALLLVLPADHQIKNVERFHQAVQQAIPLAQAGKLVTFGIQPERAETGYGYIKKGLALDAGFEVEQFVEKPTLEVAKQFLESGEYVWNSGMFLFRAGSYLEELNQFQPEMVKICRETLAKAKKDLYFIRLEPLPFANCPADSIDYAVMEKSKNVAVIPMQDSGWSDLGSWDAIFVMHNKDANNNVISGDVHAENVSNSYLHAQDRLLAVVGVSDHIVVETADAVLVAHKNASQEVKRIVASLEMKKREEIESHLRVYRPWGYYEVLDKTPQFQVKCIVVKPGASLSLQMHHHRSEHWVVIKGEAQIISGEKAFTLQANQSTYIPAGNKHRLKNATNQDLVVVEVQTGSYLGEDDIVRFDDVYGREFKVCTESAEIPE